MNGEPPKMYYRQPIGYGPAATPRRDLFTSERYPTWDKSGMHLARIVFATERSAVEAILPPGMHVEDGVEPTIMFEVMNLKNLPWLAGRGYNTTGVYINNVVHEKSGTTASHLSVLFESLCDPIVTGREELGFPKVFATTTHPIDLVDGTREYRVSWLGHEFLKLSFPNLTPISAPALRPYQHTSPSRHGHFGYRYMPAVGEPGKADAEYTVFNPPATKPDRIRAYYAVEGGQKASVKITKSTFEQLPTLHYIVNRLVEIPLGEVREQCVIDQWAASDVINTKRLD